MGKNPLDLNELTMDDIDFSGVREELEKEEQIKKEYQKNMKMVGGKNISKTQTLISISIPMSK